MIVDNLMSTEKMIVDNLMSTYRVVATFTTPAVSTVLILPLSYLYLDLPPIHLDAFKKCHSKATEEDDGDSEFIYTSTDTTITSIIRTAVADTTMTKFSSTWSIVLTVVTVAMSVALIHNLIEFYNFVAAWNLISEVRRVDLAQVYNRRLRQRRRTYQDVLLAHVHVDKMKEHYSCPICLEDFFEQDLVTACDEGCGNYFHKECLFNWLDYSNSCCCCRRDLISPKPKGWTSSFLTFVGVGSFCQPRFH
jgi:hypothetical protein